MSKQTLTYVSHPTWDRPKQQAQQVENDGENWFMRALMQELKEASPPTLLVGGKKRIGKSWAGLAISEQMVKRCQRIKIVYRDQGLPTEKKFDVSNARFRVSDQLLYSLRTLPHLLSRPPPDGDGLPYGSPIIIDEASVVAGALESNNPIVKRIVKLHDTFGFRLIPFIMMAPGGVMRVTYQIRQLCSFAVQMKARGVGMVYENNPTGFGDQYFKRRGWIGYRNPWSKKVMARIEPPTPETLREYYVLKDAMSEVLRGNIDVEIASLIKAGFAGPYDNPNDADITMTKNKNAKRQIPEEDLDSLDEE